MEGPGSLASQQALSLLHTYSVGDHGSHGVVAVALEINFYKKGSQCRQNVTMCKKAGHKSEDRQQGEEAWPILTPLGWQKQLVELGGAGKGGRPWLVICFLLECSTVQIQCGRCGAERGQCSGASPLWQFQLGEGDG